MHRRKVDLPDPDGPMTHMTSRGATSRLMPLSTSKWPNFLWTSSALTIGVGPGAAGASPDPTGSDTMAASCHRGRTLDAANSTAEPSAKVSLQEVLPDHQHAGHRQVPQACGDEHREDLERPVAHRLKLEEQVSGRDERQK